MFVRGCGLHVWRRYIGVYGEAKEVVAGLRPVRVGQWGKLRGATHTDINEVGFFLAARSSRSFCAVTESSKADAGDFDEKQVAFQVADPQALLNAIASTYSSMSRILMEYVDNAIDDVDRGMAPDFATKVLVDIDMDRRSIWIRDNCSGIGGDGLLRLIAGVGKSVKRDVAWQNGQFGFGMHSFRAAAEELHVYSLHTSGKAHCASLSRSKARALAPRALSVSEFAAEEVVADAARRGVFSFTDGNMFFTESGTAVLLDRISPVWFETIKAHALARDIENHFEAELRTNASNLSVVVNQVRTHKSRAMRRTIECNPFDYAEVDGFHFEGTLTGNMPLSQGKVLPLEVQYRIVVAKSGASPVRKPVRFFRKGRCISELTHTQSFLANSSHKTGLWDHPSVSGLVELPHEVEPVLTRDEFARSEAREYVYGMLRGLEEEVMGAVDSVMETVKVNSLVDLENALGASIDSLFSQDRRNLEESEGDELPQQQDEDQVMDTPELVHDEDGIEYIPVHDKPKPPKTKKHKNGMYAVRMYKSKAPEAKRSFLSDGQIFINVSHAQFTERLSLDRKRARSSGANITLGPRLASYLSNELAQYYRADYYQRFSVPMPSERSRLYEDLLDSSAELEQRLFAKLSATRVPTNVFNE